MLSQHLQVENHSENNMILLFTPFLHFFNMTMNLNLILLDVTKTHYLWHFLQLLIPPTQFHSNHRYYRLMKYCQIFFHHQIGHKVSKKDKENEWPYPFLVQEPED